MFKKIEFQELRTQNSFLITPKDFKSVNLRFLIKFRFKKIDTSLDYLTFIL